MRASVQPDIVRSRKWDNPSGFLLSCRVSASPVTASGQVAVQSFANARIGVRTRGGSVKMSRNWQNKPDGPEVGSYKSLQTYATVWLINVAEKRLIRICSPTTPRRHIEYSNTLARVHLGPLQMRVVVPEMRRDQQVDQPPPLPGLSCRSPCK